MTAGMVAKLRCIAGPSNPPANIHWMRGGYKLPGNIKDTSTANNGSNVVFFYFSTFI